MSAGFVAKHANVTETIKFKLGTIAISDSRIFDQNVLLLIIVSS